MQRESAESGSQLRGESWGFFVRGRLHTGTEKKLRGCSHVDPKTGLLADTLEIRILKSVLITGVKPNDKKHSRAWRNPTESLWSAERKTSSCSSTSCHVKHRPKPRRKMFLLLSCFTGKKKKQRPPLLCFTSSARLRSCRERFQSGMSGAACLHAKPTLHKSKTLTDRSFASFLIHFIKKDNTYFLKWKESSLWLPKKRCRTWSWSWINCRIRILILKNTTRTKKVLF